MTQQSTTACWAEPNNLCIALCYNLPRDVLHLKPDFSSRSEFLVGFMVDIFKVQKHKTNMKMLWTGIQSVVNLKSKH